MIRYRLSVCLYAAYLLNCLPVYMTALSCLRNRKLRRICWCEIVCMCKECLGGSNGGKFTIVAGSQGSNLEEVLVADFHRRCAIHQVFKGSRQIMPSTKDDATIWYLIWYFSELRVVLCVLSMLFFIDIQMQHFLLSSLMGDGLFSTLQPLSSQSKCC